MDFKRGILRRFPPHAGGIDLYNLVNAFLKRKTLYSIPTNKGLIILVIRKLLASSSFALVQTFRLEQTGETIPGTKSANARKDLICSGSSLRTRWLSRNLKIKKILKLLSRNRYPDEINAVQVIIDVASRISSNAKITALKQLRTAFAQQERKASL